MAVKYQRRHYISMAANIRKMLDAADDDAIFSLEYVRRFADTLCETFSRDNPRFNRMRFLIACGIKPESGGR